MSHTFLLEAGRWSLRGNWLERDGMPIPVAGKILIAWSHDDWYTMVTKLTFPSSEREPISLQYRGRLNAGDRQYAFVLQHGILGKVEGEGWIAPESIVQRYWVLGDRQRRTGFETMHQMDDGKYYMASGIMSNYYLSNAMEATVERVQEKK